MPCFGWLAAGVGGDAAIALIGGALLGRRPLISLIPNAIE